MDLLDMPSTIKEERKKNEFITNVKGRMAGIDIKNNLLEVIIFLMNAAEEYFVSKKNRTYGKLKKECVIAVIKELSRAPIDEEQVSRMIETVLSTGGVKRLGFFKKAWLFVKKRLLNK